jgi:hypothetical protein
MAVLRTIKNREILHAGIEYNLSTGPTTFTPEDLRDAVTAANEDPSIPNPRLKIGHVDPRYNGPEYDGSPAFGKATNLRLSDNGMAVIADYVGVPAWLADIMPTAYPSCSIEGWWNVESQMGKKWRFVLTACAVLGVTWPGVTVLEDLPQYFGEEVPPGVEIAPELVAASSRQPGGGPMSTSASANLDDVRRAFYNEYVPQNSQCSWWWVQAVLTDPNELVVEDDETGQLYKLSFSSDASGNVTFGESQPVRIDYIPDDRETMKAAASFVAATLAVGRQVLASWPTRAESRSEIATGGSMDPTEVRNRLGLPEDASDAQVQEALLQLLPEQAATEPVAPVATPVGEPAATTPPAPEPTTPPTTPPTPPPTPAPPPQQEAPTQQQIAASHGITLPPGTALVDEQTLATIQSTNARLAVIEERELRTTRENLVTAAIGEGRIPPARRDHWLKYLETDFEGGKATLASLTPNIVPLAERGHAVIPPANEGALVPQLDQETVAAWSEELFPEVRSQREFDRQVAAGHGSGQRQRIVSDAHYSRR